MTCFTWKIYQVGNRSDGVMVRAYTTLTVDLGMILISHEVKLQSI